MALGDVVRSFASPTNSPFALGFDGRYLWHSEFGANNIYMIDVGGYTIRVFPAIAAALRGLDVGIKYVVYCSTTANLIVIADKNLNTLHSFAVPNNNYAVVCIVDGILYVLEAVANVCHVFDWFGNEIIAYACPTATPTGLAFDGKNLWYTDRDDGNVYCLDRQMNILTSFAFGVQRRGISFDGKYLWIADSNTNGIYQISIA